MKMCVKCRALLSLWLTLTPFAWGYACSADELFANGFDPTPAVEACPDFPRLGGMLIGDPHNYDESVYQAQIARLDLAVLGIYNGWSPGGVTPRQAVAAIKARNPAILLANYTIMSEVDNDDANPSTQYKRDKLNAEVGPNGIGDWWAYDQDGQHTDWADGAYGTWDVNITAYATPDANGERWAQWLARADYSRLLQGVGFDIWYSDNNLWKPRSDADWDRDGGDDSQDDIAVRNVFRDGQRAFYDAAKALAPQMWLMVNADSDLDGSVFPPGADRFTQYANVPHGAFMEHVMGKDWSVESWGGWSLAYAWYRRLTGNLQAPRIVFFDVYLPSTTDYRYLRYAFATSLLGDAYFSASTDYNQIVWFDEYDLAGSATTKWLGKALDPPPSVAWQRGVYRRRFEHGVALVNPNGNGAQSVTLEAGYRRFQGTQAPDVNNGRSVTTLALAERDGILLLKQ